MIFKFGWFNKIAFIFLFQAVFLLFPVQLTVYSGEFENMSTEDFLAEIFRKPVKPSMFWLSPAAQREIASIVGHAPVQLRLRYWADGIKTVWILEENGKEEPITAGFVISGGRIQQARVLIYRESRGMEIHSPGFLKQYEGVGLAPDNRLDRKVDAISGATLSVSAMEKMSREALYLDRLNRNK